MINVIEKAKASLCLLGYPNMDNFIISRSKIDSKRRETNKYETAEQNIEGLLNATTNCNLTNRILNFGHNKSKICITHLTMLNFRLGNL